MNACVFTSTLATYTAVLAIRLDETLLGYGYLVILITSLLHHYRPHDPEYTRRTWIDTVDEIAVWLVATTNIAHAGASYFVYFCLPAFVFFHSYHKLATATHNQTRLHALFHLYAFVGNLYVLWQCEHHKLTKHNTPEGIYGKTIMGRLQAHSELATWAALFQWK